VDTGCFRTIELPDDIMAVQKRQHTLAFATSIALIIVVASTFGQLPEDSLLWRELQNTGHTPLFGALALAFLYILRERLPVTRTRPLAAYPLAAMASLATGIGVEFAQLLTYRDPSVTDVVRDLAGILAALGIHASMDPKLAPFWRRQRTGLRIGTAVVAGCLLLAGLAPLGRLGIACLQRDAAFPVIFDFGAAWSGPFLQLKHASLAPVPAPQRWTSAAGRHVARLVLQPAQYPGISVIEPSPDWSAFAYFVFTLYSDESRPFSLMLRIHDRLHNQEYSDRFNRALRVRPGENVFRIPLAAIRGAPADRALDLHRIAGVMLFAVGIHTPIAFYLDTMQLDNLPAAAAAAARAQ
jgi:hypothetical protein